MKELMTSMVKFSAAMTMFGVQQMRNTVEGVLDATRWTFFTGFTCPDCGAEQEVTRDLRKTLNAITNALTSHLDAANRPTYNSVSDAGCTAVNRTFDAVDAVYPVRDDLPLDENRPAPRRGYDKRTSISMLDPRRFAEVAEQQMRITADQAAQTFATDNHHAQA